MSEKMKLFPDRFFTSAFAWISIALVLIFCAYNIYKHDREIKSRTKIMEAIVAGKLEYSNKGDLLIPIETDEIGYTRSKVREVKPETLTSGTKVFIKFNTDKQELEVIGVELNP